MVEACMCLVSIKSTFMFNTQMAQAYLHAHVYTAYTHARMQRHSHICTHAHIHTCWTNFLHVSFCYLGSRMYFMYGKTSLTDLQLCGACYYSTLLRSSCRWYTWPLLWGSTTDQVWVCDYWQLRLIFNRIYNLLWKASCSPHWTCSRRSYRASAPLRIPILDFVPFCY